MRYLVFLLFLFLPFSLSAQDPATSNLAFQYYNNGDYEKAASLFDKLYSQSKSRVYYTYYFQCLIQIGDFEEAVKSIRQQVKRNPNDGNNYVDWGYLLKTQGDSEGAEEKFGEALSRINSNASQTIQLANTFVGRLEYEYAARVYIEARKKFSGSDFHFELANVYAIQRNYVGVVTEYLDMLDVRYEELSNVQAHIGNLMAQDKEGALAAELKRQLLQRLQTSRNTIYNELLIWILMQDNDYSNALTQVIALDRRFKENGARVFDFAGQAFKGGDLSTALRAYTFLIEKGPDNEFYVEAKYGELHVYYQMIVLGLITDRNEIAALETRYIDVMDDFGPVASAYRLRLDLAYLQAFYLGKQQAALALLDEMIQKPSLSPELKHAAMLLLGDVQLYSGDVWTAALTYAKVEKDNAENPVGQEAKFRKAKIAFYTGQFDWARTQLDALKASTSKLIANDAFQLAQLIIDYTTLDSVTLPLGRFARAMFLAEQKRNDEALDLLDSMVMQYAALTIGDDCLFLRAQVHARSGHAELALTDYLAVADQYMWDILADDALMQAGLLCEKTLNDPSRAMTLYERLMTEFPSSIFASEARKRFRALRGDNL